MGLSSTDRLGGSAEYDRNFVRGTGDRPGRGRGDQGPPPPPVIDYGRIPTAPPFVCFVGNLPFVVTEEEIKAIFADCKIANVTIPKERETGRCRGFAYIELVDMESMINALMRSGAPMAGRYIRVDISEGRSTPGGGMDFASDWRSGVEHQVGTGGGGSGSHYPERKFDRSMMQPVVAEMRPATSAWRSTAQPVVAEARPSFRATDSPVPAAAPEKTEAKKPVLNLLPRSKPVGQAPEPAEVYASKPSPFGDAKPVVKN